MTQAQTVTAAFAPEQPVRFILTTSISGDGDVSPPCADGCAYDAGVKVPLTATPRGENNSVAWTECTPEYPGAYACEATMSQNRNVTARFFFAEP